MLDDVWHSRDLPVLREVARRADVKPRGLRVTLQEVEEATGLSRQDVQTAGLWLLDAGLVQADVRGTSLVAAFTGITPAARTRVGLWPSPEVAADRLITVLKQAVEQAPTLEERTRRQKILTGVVESGRDFAVSLAAGVLTGQLGG